MCAAMHDMLSPRLAPLPTKELASPVKMRMYVISCRSETLSPLPSLSLLSIRCRSPSIHANKSWSQHRICSLLPPGLLYRVDCSVLLLLLLLLLSPVLVLACLPWVAWVTELSFANTTKDTKVPPSFGGIIGITAYGVLHALLVEAVWE
jgi:hypothetical protein